MTRDTKQRERWKEATPANPCPVCGAKKWCRVSPDGRVCNCRHEARGAVKSGTYRDGGEYYVHNLIDDGPKPNGRTRRKPKRSAAAKPSDGSDSGPAADGPQDDKPAADGLTDAEASTRDKAFRLLLAELPLSPEHRQDLKGRGLTDEQIDAGGYRTWPKDRKARFLVAVKLFRALGNETFVRIPGFGPGASEIHAAPGSLLIPVRDVQGRIVALVVRPDDPGDGGKYRWFSSRSERNPDGPSPGSPAHVPQEVRGPVDLALLVEGILKGDVVFRLCGIPVVAIGGASQWRNAIPILRALGVRTVRLAFDMDCLTNRLVARALVECFGGLQAEGFAVELARWNPEHKGLDDLLAANGTPETLTGPAALAAAEQIAKAASVESAPDLQAETDGDGGADDPPEFQPFPVDVLPFPIAGFIDAAAAALGCDHSFIALPLLAALAAAVGNARRVRLKESWSEPLVIWTVTVGHSGTMKSPAWELAVRPLQARQDAKFLEYRNELDEYARDAALYDADYQAWKKDGRKKGQPPPDKPDEPKAVRYLCSDATVEALAVLLEENPRGILVARDELSGWLSSFDAYKAARGADVAHWLSMHRAGPLTVDRKSGRRLIHVPRAAVSIAGSTQPEILALALGGRYEGEQGTREHFANGLAARLLMAYPPRRPKRWTDADLPGGIVRAVNDVFGSLLALDVPQDNEGRLQPVALPLTPEAQACFVLFYNAHAEEQAKLDADLAAAWSKLEGYAARFALLVHLVRDAAGDRALKNPNAVDLQSIETGITLSRWFADEAARIYSEIGGTPDDGESRKNRERGRLVEWIQGRGGAVTVRDLQRGPRQYREADAAELVLQDLADAGLGQWRTDDHEGGRGRPVRVFVLTGDGDTNSVFHPATGGDSDTNSENPRETGIVSPSPVSPEAETGIVSPGERVRVTI